MPDPAAPLLPPKRINSGIEMLHLQSSNGDNVMVLDFLEINH
jgi:hypothetical protein